MFIKLPRTNWNSASEFTLFYMQRFLKGFLSLFKSSCFHIHFVLKCTLFKKERFRYFFRRPFVQGQIFSTFTFSFHEEGSVGPLSPLQLCCTVKSQGIISIHLRPYTANLCSESAVKLQWNECNLVLRTAVHCMECLTALYYM